MVTFEPLPASSIIMPMIDLPLTFCLPFCIVISLLYLLAIWTKRAAGLALAWKAASAGDAVLIVAANADRFSGASAMCLCLAPARDGHFRIPPLALSNLPPTLDDGDLSASYVLLTEIPLRPPARIEAHGLDSAFAAFVSSTGRLVRFH